jgi:ribokinase
MGVLIVGSLNIDLVTYLEKMPEPGETVVGDRIESFPGGKGLNQAVAAARAGGDVTMVGVLGNDSNSNLLKQVMLDEKINSDHVREIAGICGTAIIEVDKLGRNRIIVIAGANSELKANDVKLELLTKIKSRKVLLSQLESPLSELLSIFKVAKSNDFFTILNPAPARKLDAEFIQFIDLLIPNQFEAEFLTGIKVTDSESAISAGKKLISQGVKSALITLGEDGSMLVTKESSELFQSFKVKAVDTTAAGDAFCGAIAVALSEEFDLKTAIRFASAAGALSVQFEGATTSLPTRQEIEKLIKK